MKDVFNLSGRFSGRRFEAREVLREIDRDDPVGEVIARAKALIMAGADKSLKGFEVVSEFSRANTIMNEWYDFLLKTMVKGDALSLNLRMGLFGLDVTPAVTLVSDSGDGSYFRTTLGEATDFTVDSGNATNRSTTTFAAPASTSVTNSAAASRFTFTGSDTIYGAFLIHGATLKSGANDSGYSTTALMAGGKLGTAQPVSSGSILDMVYTQSKA